MFSKTAFFAALVAASGAAARVLDVWDPAITSPTAESVWHAGGTYNVTWETADAPASISEGSRVVLSKDFYEDYYNPLAQGFDLRAGWVTVTIPPTTVPGDDYQIVLFGDSGNYSPTFSIAELEPTPL
ncbi:GPI anchored serine-threonine rich family protein [Phanerochaete sordida]|uniref:GPI anchored serine-threonine rich family protein n=1 Tax=Phanerochaete sordida TaxID=48140 RepID=A0A9P3GN01_9APHY|nr:GPI anchored serine-threonine rich family protein [Phanerochaete sordida]